MTDSRPGLELRPGVDVPDEMARDRLVERLRTIRAGAVLDKNTYEHWNATHPEAEPIDTSFEDAVVAWCDGRGPLPVPPGQQDGGQ